jgi:hypothetical protein
MLWKRVFIHRAAKQNKKTEHIRISGCVANHKVKAISGYTSLRKMHSRYQLLVGQILFIGVYNE